MNENELMVDDWVYGCTDPYSPDEEQKKFPVRVIRIELDGDIYTMGKNPSDDPYDYEWWNIEPIPITPEILEKNGFKKRENDIYHIGPRYVLTGGVEDYLVIVMPEDPPVHGVKFLTEIHTNCIGKSGVNTLHNCDIEYVHQLQHALRLCGIKKEIKI